MSNTMKEMCFWIFYIVMDIKRSKIDTLKFIKGLEVHYSHKGLELKPEKNDNVVKSKNQYTLIKKQRLIV